MAINAVIYERFGSISQFVFSLPLLRALPRRWDWFRRFFQCRRERGTGAARDHRAMSYGMTPSTVGEYERRAEEAERSPWPWILKAARVVVWIVYALVLVNALMLTLAFLLRLFGASADAGFVQWVDRNAEYAMRPFRGIFPSHDLEGDSVLDLSLLFAALVYFVLALIVHAVVHWLTVRLHRQERDVAAARTQADSAAQALRVQEHQADVAAQAAAARQLAAQQATAQQYAVARAAAQQVLEDQPSAPPASTEPRRDRRRASSPAAPRLTPARVSAGSDDPEAEVARSSCRVCWRCGRRPGSAGSTTRGRGTTRRA